MSEQESPEQDSEAVEKRIADLKKQLEDGKEWSAEDEEFMLAHVKDHEELEEEDEE